MTSFMGRLLAAYGTPVAGLRAFPGPQELAAIPGVELQAVVGLTGARTHTLHTVAEKWADGFSFTGLTVDEARRALLALPGIGPWTADFSPCVRCSIPTPSPRAIWSHARPSGPSLPRRRASWPWRGRLGDPMPSCISGPTPPTGRSSPHRRESDLTFPQAMASSRCRGNHRRR